MDAQPCLSGGGARLTVSHVPRGGGVQLTRLRASITRLLETHSKHEEQAISTVLAALQVRQTDAHRDPIPRTTYPEASTLTLSPRVVRMMVTWTTPACQRPSRP